MDPVIRSLSDLASRSLGGPRTRCKCCGGTAPLFGQVDFNKNCKEIDGFQLPPAGIEVPYYRCEHCGFLFTRFCDHWTQAEFQAHIYNDDYAAVDPEYLASRPDGWADGLAGIMGKHFPDLSVLDWGGGTGRLADGLRAKGIRHAETWEPFNPDFLATPQGPFNLVTCIEVLEHLPDPRTGMGALAGFLPGDGALLLSTLLQPDDIEAIGCRWWYLAPRNGHISLLSRKCLEGLLAERGFHLLVYQPHIHFAWRHFPEFLAEVPLP